MVWRDQLYDFGLVNASSVSAGRVLATACGIQSSVLGCVALFTAILESHTLARGLIGMVSLVGMGVLGTCLWHKDDLSSNGQLTCLTGAFCLVVGNAVGLMGEVACPSQSGAEYRVLEEPLVSELPAEDVNLNPGDAARVKEDGEPEDGDAAQQESSDLGYGTLKLLQLTKGHRSWLYAGCAALLFRLPFSISMAHWVSASIGCVNDGDYEGARWNVNTSPLSPWCSYIPTQVMALFCAGTVDSVMDFW